MPTKCFVSFLSGKTFNCVFKTPPHLDHSLITNVSGFQSAWTSALLVEIVTQYSGFFPDPHLRTLGTESRNSLWMSPTDKAGAQPCGILDILLHVRSEDQYQPCYKSVPDSLSLRGMQVSPVHTEDQDPIPVPSRRGFKTVLSAQVCGLISSHSAGGPRFSPCPSPSVANSPLICDIFSRL